MDLSLLIINIVAGALVGYITKTLAINMLFKKYPIIGGAEIIKDRENLEIAMSELVEERLIKPSTMLEEFQKEEFKVSFELLVTHIVQNTINENIKNIDTISEISGFHETSANLHNFLNTNRERILEPCVEALFNNVMIKDVLSREQLKNVVEKLLVILSASVIDNLESIVTNFSAEIGDKYIYQLVSPDFLLKIADNLIMENFHLILEKNFSGQIDNYLDEVYLLLDIDNTLDKVEASLKNKTIFELIRETDDKNKGIEHLVSRLSTFLNSEKGNIILTDFLAHLIEILKTIEVPLSSLLTTEIEEKILQFVEKHLPDLLIRVEEWVALNKSEMEEMLNGAIEEHLESENLVKQIVGNIFVQKLAERYKIVETTLDELKEMAKKTGPNIINLANRFLDNTKISDLVIYLETNFLDHEALTVVITELFNKYLPRINLAVFDKIFARKLADIPGISRLNFKTIFKEHFYSQVKQQLKEKLLFSPELGTFLRNLAFKEITRITKTKMSGFLPDKENDTYKKVLFDFISSGKFQDSVINKISEEVPLMMQDKTINQVITADIKKDLYLKLGSLYNSKIDDFLQILKKEKVATLYKRTAKIYTDLCKNRFFSKQITDTLINLMVHLIRENKLLDRKIYVAVKESFSKFSDDELKAEMNSFMGKELQPIKLLGAFLGAVVGIIMYYLSFIPGSSHYVTGYWALLSYPLSYAVTEVGTNWLAIKMLFKPYNQRRIPLLNIAVPFTPGIFAKNKAALAESMVNFIDKKLLSKDNMVEILERYHHKWKEVIKGVIAKNNYKIVDDTLNKYAKENYDTVSPVLLELGFDELNKNKEIISGYLIDEVKNLNMEELDLDSLKIEISHKIDESNTNLKNVITNEIFINDLDFGKSLHQLLPENIFNEINKFLAGTLKSVTENVSQIIGDDEKLNSYFTTVADRVDAILDHKLEEIVAPEKVAENKKSLTIFLENQIKDKVLQDKALDYLENKFFDKGISSVKEIRELFDGKLISTVIKESDVIMDSFSMYILNISKKKKEDLVKIILADIEKKGIFESMLVRFGGIRNDVRGIVDVMVDHKLQPYLENKKLELKNLFKVYVENNISRIKLYELGLTEDVFDFANIKAIISKNVLNNQKIFSISGELFSLVIDDILKNLTVKEILGTLNLHSTLDIVERFNNEIAIARSSTSYNLEAEKALFVTKTMDLGVSIFEKSIYQLPLNSLLKDLSKSEIMDNIGNVVDLVYTTKTFKELKNSQLNYFFKNLNENITGILDYKILQRDLANMIHNLTENNNGAESRRANFQMDIKHSVKDITINFVEVLNENVEKETKEVVQNILVNSLVDSLRINNREVLNPIDFDAIVRNEVHKMDPSRIEAMFDFAKPIFRLLIMYGALGGVIGLAVGIFEAFR
jgi:uncharacterized membrane protein YheB (UPF0754 family)